MIAGVVRTMADYQPKTELLARDTTVFCILEKFGDFKDNLNQQLREEKELNRSLAKEHLDLKVEIDKNCFGKQKPSRATS